MKLIVKERCEQGTPKRTKDGLYGGVMRFRSGEYKVTETKQGLLVQHEPRQVVRNGETTIEVSTLVEPALLDKLCSNASVTLEK